MSLKSEEISWILEQEIKKYTEALDFESVGRVIELGDGIVRIWGLQDVMMSEILEFSNGTKGMVLNLEADNIGAVLFGSDVGIKEQSVVKRTGKQISIPVGEALLGRVVDPLGVPLDEKGPIVTNEYRFLEGTTPNVVQRKPVYDPVQTGIKAIDSMIPIGRGQRELIIGDRQTGKTTIILDTIINQKGKNLICIYVAIGQKASSISQIVQTLESYGAMEYTIVVAAPASDPAALQYIAPYAATAMGEYFMYKGQHAICFYDDLSKHAQAYRQMSLLLRRPPGREAYPGDIFYLHARLLERSAQLNDKMGGGSLTAIPVIETQANDLAAYIPTNVISITDGQIFLEPDLFYAGIRPAVNVGVSVSRVGGKAQTPAMKKVAGSLRLDLAQFRELAAFKQFGSELDEVTQSQIRRGERMVEILKQEKFKPCSMEHEVMIIYTASQGHLDTIPLELIKKYEEEFYQYTDEKHPSIAHNLATSKELSPKTKELLDVVGTDFTREFIIKHGLK